MHSQTWTEKQIRRFTGIGINLSSQGGIVFYLALHTLEQWQRFCIDAELRIWEVSFTESLQNVNINNEHSSKTNKLSSSVLGSEGSGGIPEGPPVPAPVPASLPPGLQSSRRRYRSSWRIIVPYAWDFRAKAFERWAHPFQFKLLKVW